MEIRGSIIILVYSTSKDQFEMTINCIKSIRQFDTISEILIINNGSSWFDQQSLAPLVSRVVSLPINLGFGFANNLGARVAKNEILLFLNNDTIWEENILRKLIVDKAEFISGASGAKLRFENQVLIFDQSDNKNFDYIEGWCLLVKKVLFNKLNGFDEVFGLVFSEDADFCLRAKYQFKIPLIVVPCQIQHLRGQTVSKLSLADLNRKNSQLLTKRWGKYFRGRRNEEK